MATSNTSKSPDASVPLNMRIKPATRNLIDRAAELLGKTRTDFMLEASERRAEEVLLDRSYSRSAPKSMPSTLLGSRRPRKQMSA